MADNNFDVDDFEKRWSLLGKEICQAIYILPRAQEIKNALQKNGVKVQVQASVQI